MGVGLVELAVDVLADFFGFGLEIFHGSPSTFV
jgi:hypothetical protein